ncbi:Mycothiol acetyltransferase [Streptomyces rubrolavendulae]|uniref:Mycothiol acetyltransferase n=1 Tax=Streptomyces rubrolavendulae TaxID=285473 RepID=A0A1D8G2R0_9ACTN|nr:Mycothiol acetyltransferase [Streptomyces rubrolavendulae]
MAVTYAVRSVRGEEWREVRRLRLDALRDPVAPLAFLDTYEDAVARPDGYWRERTEGAAEDSGTARQFVAVAPDGRWVGSVTALVERRGAHVPFGEAPEMDQTHLVGVYVRPEARGTGLAPRLLVSAVRWSWALRDPVVGRARLYVHERNGRAAALYRRVGFEPTGRTLPVQGEPGAVEVEYAVVRPAGVPGGCAEDLGPLGD